jgi:predicted ATP-dependent endonuclease of OLD family
MDLVPDDLWGDIEGVQQDELNRIFIKLQNLSGRPVLIGPSRQGVEEIEQLVVKLSRIIRRIDITESISNVDRDKFNRINDTLGKLRSEVHKAETELRETPAAPDEAIQGIYDIIYIDEIRDIPDEIKIEELQNSERQNTVYHDLFAMSDIPLNRFYAMNPAERKRQKESISKELQKEFNDYWDRDLSIELEFGGDAVSLHVSDDNESQLVSQRSDGLQHFLSFFISVFAKAGGELEDKLILIDNPGIHLHPEVQKGLTQGLEKVAKNNQIVYTTHSPFMINKNDLGKVRVVERDGNENGTTVNSLDEYDENESDALKPIRSSIGAEVADSLFGANKNVIVEGYSDRRFLNQLNHLIDEDFFGGPVTFVDANGSGKVSYYAKIMETENYDYAVLLDSDKGGQDAERNLRKDTSINVDKKVHYLTDSVQFDRDDITIEDLFESELYYEYASEVIENSDRDYDIDEYNVEDMEGEKTVGVLASYIGEELETGQDLDEEMENLKKEIAKKICSDISEGRLTIDELGEEKDRFGSLLNDLSEKISNS